MQQRQKFESFVSATISNKDLKNKLEKGLVNPNELTIVGSNALNETIKCLKHLQAERITLLLKHGTNINQRQYSGDGNTPLHTFIANELPNQVKHMIAEAARFGQEIDYTIRDSEGKNTLIFAAKLHHEEIALHILMHAVKQRNFDVNAADKDGMTALHYACALGMPALASELIKCGASTTVKNKKDRTPVDCTALDEADVCTILRSASIEPMRDEKAEYNCLKDKYNQEFFWVDDGALTPIPDMPAVRASESLLKEVLKLKLMDSGLLYQVGSKEITPPNPIQYIASNPMSDADKQAILAEFDSFTGTTVLQVIMRERLNAQAVLIANGANYSWLLRSYSANNNDQLLVLLARDDIAQYINAKGVPSLKTALHFAAAKNNIRFCEALVAHAAALNEVDRDGNTPLHLACLAGHQEAVLWLVERGADVSIKNENDQTVFAILAKKGLHELSQQISAPTSVVDVDVDAGVVFKN